MTIRIASIDKSTFDWHLCVDRLITVQKTFCMFEELITKAVPPELAVPDRNVKLPDSSKSEDVDRVFLVYPKDKKYYARTRARFVRDVSSKPSQTLFTFLFQYKVTFASESSSLFIDCHAKCLSRATILKIKDNHPRLDRATVAEIFSDEISPTYVAYRLDDLQRIGLISLSNVTAPRSKFVQITDLGMSIFKKWDDIAKSYISIAFQSSDISEELPLPSSTLVDETPQHPVPTLKPSATSRTDHEFE